MEYLEVRQIIEDMEKDGWTINNADIHFLKRYSEYVLRKHAVSSSVCPCNELPDGEIAISSKALQKPYGDLGQTDC